MKKSLEAVQIRANSLFPRRVNENALDYIKTIERILDYQNDMIGVNQDVLKNIQEPHKRDAMGLGKQRIRTAQAKTLGMLNSFKLDFSGQLVTAQEKIKSIGRIIRNKRNMNDLMS